MTSNHQTPPNESSINVILTLLITYQVHNPTRILSGGDDNSLKLWDIRSAGCAGSATPTISQQPAMKNSKTHQSGVTSLQYHPHRQHVFASGSYDECVRVWDDRMLTKPAATLHVGGGVWRTKWFLSGTKSGDGGGGGGGDHDDDWCLALACMQGGSCVARYSSSSSSSSSSSTSGDCNDTPTLTKVLTHPQDPSLLTERHLAYGIGVLHEKANNNNNSSSDSPQHQDQQEGALLASCSFYENSVHLWKY